MSQTRMIFDFKSGQIGVKRAKRIENTPIFRKALNFFFCGKNFQILLRLGAQSFTLLNTLRDPTQLRRRQWATRQQHLIFGCPLLSSLEQLISAPNHE